MKFPKFHIKFAHFWTFRPGWISSKDLSFHLKSCIKFVLTWHYKWKIKIRRSILEQNSSKHVFFMSKIWIVARRSGSQLATTAPVLLFTWAIALCYELFWKEGLSYPSQRTSQNQASQLSFPNCRKHFEVRRCRVSVLNNSYYWTSMPIMHQTMSYIGPQCLQSIRTIPYYCTSMPPIHPKYLILLDLDASNPSETKPAIEQASQLGQTDEFCGLGAWSFCRTVGTILRSIGQCAV